jgi:predicted metal-dependent hydrolase
MNGRPVILKTIWLNGQRSDIKGTGLGNQFSVHLDGEDVPVKVRRNAQAKRLTLRVDSITGEIKLTLPKYVSERAATRFLNEQQNWLSKERAAIDIGAAISCGSEIPFLGEPHRVVFTGKAPRNVKRGHANITVGGPTDMAPKRLENWFRREAKKLLEERAADHAAGLGLSYNRVSIGDMKSRWGSCSSSGTLRFSWRLLMAPFDVLDYVAAHEVAHLAEMNHSDRFWAQVARRIPDHKSRRAWLRSDGSDLFRIRFSA